MIEQDARRLSLIMANFYAHIEKAGLETGQYSCAEDGILHEVDKLLEKLRNDKKEKSGQI